MAVIESPNEDDVAVYDSYMEYDEAKRELEGREELVTEAEDVMDIYQEDYNMHEDLFKTSKDTIVNKLKPLAKKINELIDEYWGIDPTLIKRATGKEVWEKFEKQRGKDVPTSYKPDDALEYRIPTTSPSKLQEKATEVKNKLEDLSNKEKETKGLILPDPVLQEELTMITTLEINFRKLVETVFKDIPNWWNELVPDDIRGNARYRNDRNPDFLKWDKTQDFKLLEKLNFTALSKIFTGDNCWKYFSSVFPSPEGENSDMMWSIKPKLRETSYCRNRVGHSIRLNERMHDVLKAYHDYFMDCLKTFFENRNV